MAHKSNGYIYTDDAVPSLIRNGVITFYNRLERYQEQAATLVMHGGKKHERVFTESEVRAMMDDVKAIAAEHSRKCYTNHIEQMTPPAPVAFHIDNYLWKSHGFSSDPA